MEFSDEVVKKSRQLHQSSLVIDSLAPRVNCDLLLTPEMAEEAAALLRRGNSYRDMRVELATLLARHVRNDDAVANKFREIWDVAGVDIASTTQLGAVAPNRAFDEALEMVQATRGLIDALSPDFQLVTSSADIERIADGGLKGIIMNLQNAQAFEGDLNNIERFYNLGVRVVQLTYNRRNNLGDGCTEDSDGGLSYYGREVLRLLNELNVMVDLSHCGPQTTWDAIETSTKPVSFTHTSAKSVCPHDRAKTDEQIRAVAEMGGYIGVLCVPAFIQKDPQGDLSNLARHVEHIIDVAGVENVGIGTDHGVCYQISEEMENARKRPAERHDLPTERKFDWVGWRAEHRIGAGHEVDGFSSWTDWPNITAMLVEMGLSDEDIVGLLGGNFRRVFGALCG